MFLVSTVFYICQVISYALFIKISIKWLDFNKSWLTMEKRMEKYSYQPNYYKRFKITTITIVVLAMGMIFFLYYWHKLLK